MRGERSRTGAGAELGRTEQRRLRKEEARREEWRSKHRPRLCRKPLRTVFTTDVAFISLNNEAQTAEKQMRDNI